MSRLIDISGERYGRLVVVERNGSTSTRRNAKWLCRCDCGKNTIAIGTLLRNGTTKSCGCYRVDVSRERETKHNMSESRVYNCWAGMVQRCTNKNNAAYENYGGRGIKVCAEWMEFKPFLDWALANGYDDALTIDRINNDGNYEPQNCRWATYAQQNRNQRKRRWRRKPKTHDIRIVEV